MGTGTVFMNGIQMRKGGSDYVSFGSGELNPLLHNRFDLAKYQNGLAELINGYVVPEGVVARTAGTVFMEYHKTQNRPALYLKFFLNPENSFILVLNGGFIRFLTPTGLILSSGTPYEIAHSIADSDLDKIRYTQIGDYLILCGVGRPLQIIRNSNTNWQISNFGFKYLPFDEINTTDTQISVSAETGNAVTITASTGIFNANMVGSQIRLSEDDFSGVPTWVGGDGKAYIDGDRIRNNGNVYKAVVTGGLDKAGPNAPNHLEGTVQAGAGFIKWQFVHNLEGYAEITNFTNATTVTAKILQTIPGSCLTGSSFGRGATKYFSFSAYSNHAGWPNLVTLFAKRLWFVKDRRFDASRIDDFNNFKIGELDDDAITFTPSGSSGISDTLLYLMPTKGALIVGGTIYNYVIRSGRLGEPLTPVNVRSDDYVIDGTADHIPIALQDGYVYIARGRRKIIYTAYSTVSEELEQIELTRYARHISQQSPIKKIIYKKEPHNIIYCLHDNGTLSQVTFNKREEIIGWSRLKFNGFINDIITLESNDAIEDTVFLSTTYNTKFKIEKFAPSFNDTDFSNTAQNAIFTESSLIYTGSPVQTVTGLDHLNGKTVEILADGGSNFQKIVTSGQITLDTPASKIIIGMALDFTMKTLPIILIDAYGSRKKTLQKISEVSVSYYRTRGGQVHCETLDGAFRAELLNPTGAEPLDDMPELQTGIYSVNPECNFSEQIQIVIQNKDPLPMTIQSISFILTAEGG